MAIKGIEPKDRPKLIGLVVALVGVVGYVLIVMLPKLSAGSQAPPHAEAPPTNLTAASAAAPASGGPGTGAGEASAALPDADELPIPPTPHRDSFTPPPALSRGAIPVPAQPAATPVVPAAGPVPGTVGAPVLGLVAPAAVAAPPAPVLPPIELKGVILGDPAVAVLSVNGEVVQRQVGDVILGGLKLAKITEAGIFVQEGAKQVAVTVGHMMPGTGAPAQGGPAVGGGH